MGRSTGPILAAGAITWANNVLLEDVGPTIATGGVASGDLFSSTVQIGVATGLAAGILFGVEKLSGDMATALAWAALLTVVLVRVRPGIPTPIERALALANVGD